MEKEIILIVNRFWLVISIVGFVGIIMHTLNPLVMLLSAIAVLSMAFAYVFGKARDRKNNKFKIKYAE